MAKFHGFIGFSSFSETAPGVHQEAIVEQEYTGEFLRDAKRWSPSENLNDNLALQSRVSVIADPFALDNIAAVRYVKWNGVKWKVNSIEHQRPRLILQLGEVYNG